MCRRFLSFTEFLLVLFRHRHQSESSGLIRAMHLALSKVLTTTLRTLYQIKDTSALIIILPTMASARPYQYRLSVSCRGSSAGSYV